MIKIGSALAEIATHRPQNFYVDSQNLYALGVHGDFHLDTCLATWTRGHVADSKSPDTSSTYICPDPRKKVSSSSDQYWPRAVACNVAIINSAKSELNWLTKRKILKIEKFIEWQFHAKAIIGLCTKSIGQELFCIFCPFLLKELYILVSIHW